MRCTSTGEDSMSMTDKELIKIATEARKKAYAPYSKFKVGAALLCSDGRVFTGCNVENATYGATCCAERTAIFKAVSEGAREFLKIAVVTGSSHIDSPCGICRQVLFEFTPDLRVIMANTKGKSAGYTIKKLLPAAFSLKK
jgi:cytidine deaminase